MPRLMPCRSSPPPGATSSRNRSIMSATAVSDWPTPTVSTITTSKPAASHSSIASRVRRATPPSVVPAGRRADEGARRARPARPCGSCRRGSSRRRAASWDRPPAPRRAWPRAISRRPKRSMKVDLPTPGGPEMPMRMAPPVCGSSRRSAPRPPPGGRRRVDSTSVIARASARRSPRGTAAASLAAGLAPSPPAPRQSEATSAGCGSALARCPARSLSCWRRHIAA